MTIVVAKACLGIQASVNMPAGPKPTTACVYTILLLRSIFFEHFSLYNRMKLVDATSLLGGQARYFSDVYKLYDFKDDQLLKDYLDFITHEPVEWMKGFPAKLTQKGSFSRPKAAVIKLLKHADVIEVLGEPYTQSVYDVVWNTFKKHIDAILAKRQHASIDHEDAQSSEPPHMQITEDAESVHSATSVQSAGSSMHSVRIPKRQTTDWEKKYRVLEQAYIQLVKDGVNASALTLLSALSSA